MQSHEWNRIQYLNLEISHLQKHAALHTEPEIHANSPPKPSLTRIRLHKDRNQNNEDQRYGDIKAELNKTMTQPRSPESSTLVVITNLSTPDIPPIEKIRDNQAFKILNYYLTPSNHLTDNVIPIRIPSLT